MMPSITLEEHYISSSLGDAPENANHYKFFTPDMVSRLRDLGEQRLAAMDAGGVSIQVISHGPGVGTSEQCCSANDQLASAVGANSTRFAGFGTLPMGDPPEAAKELERCIQKHKFVGALLENHYEGRFYDDESFWPVFEMAEKLGCVLYIHPAFPDHELAPLYKGNYAPTAEFALGAFGWGWHVNTGLHILRLFAAGVFDRFPELQIVIGHMGELLPYQLERVERAQRRGMFGPKSRSLREVWDNNISVTTSGMFSLNPMACMLRNTKVERIMYSVDYPFSSNEEGMQFLKELESSGMVTQEELECIAYKNAERLLKLKVT